MATLATLAKLVWLAVAFLSGSMVMIIFIISAFTAATKLIDDAINGKDDNK